MEQIALIENIYRSDFYPIELAKAYKNLLNSGFIKFQKELSSKIAVKPSTISEYL